MSVTFEVALALDVAVPVTVAFALNRSPLEIQDPNVFAFSKPALCSVTTG
jgi:hypothetical protein